jgi:hypothetical protein
MEDRTHATPTRLLKVALVGLAALFSLAVASNALAQPSTVSNAACGSVIASAQAEDTDEVVLPSRVANAIARTQTALANAAEHLDEGEYKQVIVSLRAVKNNMYRADRAARAQMNAVPPVDPEDPEGGEDAVTTGPDSVVAVLTLDQTIVTSLSGLFDTHSQGVVVALTHTLFQTMSARDKLLASVFALDPEGAGADYADGMADTLDGYTDEVANLQEALNSDALSAGGRRVLTAALTKSQATLAAITAAFGGGE